MAFDLASIGRGGEVKPPIMTLHGGPGIGKTTLAVSAPSPIVIRTEDGLGNLAVDAFPLASDWQQILEAMSALYQGQHEYKTVIIDSMSALEPLIWHQVAIEGNQASIEEFGYGKGYVMALEHWHSLLRGLAALRDQRGMMAILIAHSDVIRFDSPEVEPYDRYQIKLHKRAFQLLHERSDIIAFAGWRTSVVKDEVGFKKTVSRGVGSGERLLHLVEKPAFIAKNRYNLPETIPLSWDAFAKAMESVAPGAIPLPAQPPASNPPAQPAKPKTKA